MKKLLKTRDFGLVRGAGAMNSSTEALDLADATQRRNERATEEDARRRKLHADGLSDAQIARALGGSQRTVRGWRQRAGLKSNGNGAEL